MELKSVKSFATRKALKLCKPQKRQHNLIDTMR